MKQIRSNSNELNDNDLLVRSPRFTQSIRINQFHTNVSLDVRIQLVS